MADAAAETQAATGLTMGERSCGEATQKAFNLT